MSLARKELTEYLNNLLRPQDYNDYCPNGLQIDGREIVSRIAFAVSATRDSITKAMEWGADTLIVHHGLFWKFHGTRTLTGPFGKRVLPLVRNEINLYGYHLPLDAHLEVGNAAGVASLIGLGHWEPFGDHKGSPTGVMGMLPEGVTAEVLRMQLQKHLDHEIILASPNEQEEIRSVGIITGGANSDWLAAYDAGLDAYITGEISEHDWHESQEYGIHMFAGGHNATEQFGVQNLMKKVEDEFGLTCKYIPSENPA